MRKIILLFALLLCSSCDHSLFANKPVFLETEVTYGPQEFRDGYKDGCESALSAYGNSMQRTMYSLKKDPKYETNRVYNQVWKDSWSYCYMWLFVQMRNAPLTGKSLL